MFRLSSLAKCQFFYTVPIKKLGYICPLLTSYYHTDQKTSDNIEALSVATHDLVRFLALSEIWKYRLQTTPSKFYGCYERRQPLSNIFVLAEQSVNEEFYEKIDNLNSTYDGESGEKAHRSTNQT